jgi:hypothetical protein
MSSNKLDVALHLYRKYNLLVPTKMIMLEPIFKWSCICKKKQIMGKFTYQQRNKQTDLEQ